MTTDERSREDFTRLDTEQRNERTMQLDKLTTLELVKTLHAENHLIAGAIDPVVTELAKLVDITTERLKKGGRLFYVGAGTSGRLGVLDASECPPTFSVSPDMVQGVIAGGEKALTRSVEGAEDYEEQGERDLSKMNAAGCSKRTIYAHADIWRQDYEDLAEDFFAIGTGEYNAVEDPSVSVSSIPEFLKEDPPGLIAARAVVFDLMTRSKKESRIEHRPVRMASEAVENDWHVKVATLTKYIPSELTAGKLRSHLIVLTNYLTLAPYEEDARLLVSYISSLRKELRKRCSGPEHPS